jgi:hypothetical protein
MTTYYSGTMLGIEQAGMDMVAARKKQIGSEEQEWENPQNPEDPSDARDKEQILRQYAEAKRRKDNLTEKDHIDKPKTN